MIKKTKKDDVWKMYKLKINSHSHTNLNQTKRKRQKLIVPKKKKKTSLENQNKEWKKVYLKMSLKSFKYFQGEIMCLIEN